MERSRLAAWRHLAASSTHGNTGRKFDAWKGDDAAAWHSLLGAAGDIRGFGPVKMQAIETVRASVTEQLAAIGQKIGQKIGQN